MIDLIDEKENIGALSTETRENFEGKVIGGHPLFSIDLEDVIRSEIKFDNPNLDAEEIEKRTQEQLDIGGYKDTEVPSYQVNNGVYLILEPNQEAKNGYAAYMTAFPSEERFQLLKHQNPELGQYESVGDYMKEISGKFALPIGASYDPTQEGMYQRKSMYVPFSSHFISDVGIQTPLSAMVDQIIKRISSK